MTRNRRNRNVHESTAVDGSSRANDTKVDEDRGKKREATTQCSDLPEELWLQILTYLSHAIEEISSSDPAYNTFLSFTLTNRRLSRLASEFMYERFTSRHGNPSHFLRTVSERPDIALSLRSIEWNFSHHDTVLAKKSKPTPTDRRNIRAILNRLRLPNRPLWFSLYDRGSSLGIFSLLLLQIPNIERLTIRDDRDPDGTLPNGPWVDRYPWLDLLADASQGRPYGKVHRFDSLHTLHVASSWLSLFDVCRVFLLPSLRVVELRGFDATSTLFSWNLPKLQYPIEELRFYKCCLDTHALGVLIKACQALKNFVYDHDSHIQEGDDERVTLRYEGIGKALSFHSSSLETVCFSNSTAPEDPLLFDIEHEGQLGSFRDFEKLRFLMIDWTALMGAGQALVDILPRALQHLAVLLPVEEWEIVSCFDTLQCSTGRLQNQGLALQKLTLYFRQRNFHYDLDMSYINSFEQRFRRANVDVEIGEWF